MKIEIWLIYLQLRRFFTASKTFIWANVVCRKMKSPTKRIFYHFGVYTLYMGTILVAFWHCGYCWGIVLLLKRQLKRLSGKKFPEISQ